jgi:hypothetical protein
MKLRKTRDGIMKMFIDFTMNEAKGDNALKSTYNIAKGYRRN